MVHADMGDAAAPLWPPFHLLSVPGISAAQQRQCATAWLDARLQADRAARQAAITEFALHPPPPREQGAPLRIGYLSSDFHQHATALLLVEMLEAHDRTRFELHAYSHGTPDKGLMRHRLQRAFHAFHDIQAWDDEQAARAIHADGIHILVDLKGYTAGSRTLLLSWRAAPIQVSFLGYPGTLGQSFVDYLISDRFVTPHAAQPAYSEALACLPHSYQPHGRATRRDKPPSRADVGLPDEALVLCCFNQAWKFTPEVFDIWCTLMHAAPDSVLWLLHDERAQGNLRQEAMARGIAPHRLVFAPDTTQAAHLARLQLADLVLDTWPYNAHTTASDALCAGVPVLTCAGDTFASRVAGSLLHAVGMPALVTHTAQAYEAMALALVTDRPRLQALRHQLHTRIPDAPLFDVAGYTQHLEAMFELMWARHHAGQAPTALDL